MRTLARYAIVLFFAICLTSCRSAAPPTGRPFQSLIAATPSEAWQELISQRASFSDARAFAKVTARTPEGRASFRITIAFQRDGEFIIQVLSPAGTTLRTISARGSEITIQEGDQNRIESIAELGRMLGIPTAGWTAADVSLLLLGLPPVAEVHEVASDRYQSADGRFEYQVRERGLQRVSAGEVEVSYDPPQFPPHKIAFRTAAGYGFQLEYLELLRQ